MHNTSEIMRVSVMRLNDARTKQTHNSYQTNNASGAFILTHNASADHYILQHSVPDLRRQPLVCLVCQTSLDFQAPVSKEGEPL